MPEPPKVISWSRKLAYCCGLPNSVGTAPRSTGDAIRATLIGKWARLAAAVSPFSLFCRLVETLRAVGVEDVLPEQDVAGRVPVGDRGCGPDGQDGKGHYGRERGPHRVNRPART